jgi:hypothetical protein
MIDTSQVKVLKENKVYRMSDLVLGCGPRHPIDRETIVTDPQYRGTILYDYLTKTQRTDRELFVQVVRQHMAKYPQADPNELVMHMRLGDVMEPRLAETEQEIRCKSIYQHYVSFLGRLSAWIKEHKRVTIVTALHFGANELNNRYFYTQDAEDKSFEVLQRVSEVFEAWGLEVGIQSSENVDEDFCFMASSTNFMGSTSKFAELVYWCLKDGATCHLM